MIGLDLALVEFDLQGMPFHHGIDLQGLEYKRLYALDAIPELVEDARLRAVDIMGDEINHSSVAV